MDITDKGDYGLFGFVKDATIKNFTIYGEVESTLTAKPDEFNYGVIGEAQGSTIITDVHSHVNLTINDNYYRNFIGGIIGSNNQAGENFAIERCSFSGKLNLGAAQVDCTGGIIAYVMAGHTVKINNCLFDGEIISKYNDGPMQVGGLMGYYRVSGLTITNSLSVGDITVNNNTKMGEIVGILRQHGSANQMVTNNYYLEGKQPFGNSTDSDDITDSYDSQTVAGSATAVTEAQLKSGEVAYLLNGSTSEGDLAWYQTIGTDVYPQFTGPVVYYDSINGYKNIVHDCTYTIDGNKIIATCNDSECNASGYVTISAPSDLTYTGNKIEAVIDNQLPLGANVTVTYTGETTNGYPVNVGSYTVSITLGDKTVSVDFTIVKADPTVTAPTAKEGLTYNGNEQELIERGTATGGTMLYSLTENGTFSDTIPIGTSAGEYTVWYYVQGDKNCYDSEKSFVNVIIAPTANYTEEVTTTQNVIREKGEFIFPGYTGINNDPVDGTLVYTYDGDGYSHAELVEKLKTLAADMTVSVGYTFTPTDRNYAQKTGTLNLTIHTVKFTVNGALATADNAIIRTGEFVYGDLLEDRITISEDLIAELLDAFDENPDNFSFSRDSQTLLSVGTHTIQILYNGTIYGVLYEDVVVCEFTVTVSQKAVAPEIQWPTASGLTYGQKLSESILTSADENGTFAWKDGNTVPTVTNSGYVVVYIPNDTDNYDYTVFMLEKTIAVDVSRKTVTITADNKTICVDGTYTLTYTVNGLLEGDTLITNPTPNTNATVATAGEYAITVNGATVSDNYAITYENGTLTVRNHAYNGAITTNPTCTTVGKMTYTCSHDSSHTYTEDVDALGHTEEAVAGKAATCTEKGLTDGKKCSVCDETLTAQTEIAALGHKYDNACDSECNTCGEERTPAEHVDADENNSCDECGAELPKDGLSGGTIAGIVVGSVAILGGGGFALWWFVFRKKRII